MEKLNFKGIYGKNATRNPLVATIIYIEGIMRKTILSILILVGLYICSSAAWAYAPLTLTYAGGSGSGGSDSKFSNNVWDYTYQYHVLVLNGETSQGKLYSQLQLEQRDNVTGLGYAKFRLAGDTYSIDLGDNIANFSDLTLNYMAYQGGAITLKPDKGFSITVLGGAKGNGNWGTDVRRDTRPKDTFSGVRSVFTPWAGIGLSTTYLTASDGNDVFAYGSDINYNGFKLGAEYGSSTVGKAFRGEVKYSSDLFYLGTIYRNVDADYNVPFDYISYKGMKGTYTSAGFTPWRNFTMNIQSDSYKDSLNGTGEASNLDTRGDMTYNMDSGTSIGYSGWRNDRSNYDRGGVTEGEMMYITQQFWLLTRNAVYYRLQPTWFTSASTCETSYKEEKNVVGLNIALFDSLHLNYGIENTTRVNFLQDMDVKVNPSAVTARMDLFETQILNSPFYLSSSVNYRKDLPDRDSTMESTSTYGDMTVKYVPSEDLSCYLTGKVFDIKSPDADMTAREETDISFGLQCKFNTGFYLK